MLGAKTSNSPIFTIFWIYGWCLNQSLLPLCDIPVVPKDKVLKPQCSAQAHLPWKAGRNLLVEQDVLKLVKEKVCDSYN